jgi:type I restriction enzyme S subunit
MASEWKRYKFRDLGRIITGKTPPTAQCENYGGRIPFITPTDMVDDRKVIGDTIRTLSDAGLNCVKGSLLPARSVVVSCIGSDMGKVAINACDAVTNQQINSIAVSSAFNTEFVYYSLKGRKDQFQTLARGGSAQPILNKSPFSELTLCAPHIDEQAEIAGYLAVLDQRIASLQVQSEILETIANTIFKSYL